MQEKLEKKAFSESVWPGVFWMLFLSPTFDGGIPHCGNVFIADSQKQIHMIKKFWDIRQLIQRICSHVSVIRYSIWNIIFCIELRFLMQCVFLARDKNGSQFPVPLKPDKKGGLSKKTAWFLGTVSYIEFAKEFKTMQDHLAIQS